MLPPARCIWRTIAAFTISDQVACSKPHSKLHLQRASPSLRSALVVQACLPNGQLKPFLHNCMALMTGTGAKGSQVNFSQISCLLGQQVRLPKACIILPHMYLHSPLYNQVIPEGGKPTSWKSR